MTAPAAPGPTAPRPPAPRIEREELPSPRLDAGDPVVLAVPSDGPGTASLMLAGAVVLGLGLAGLATGNFVADQFARASALGWATLGVAATGFGLLGAGIWRELRGLLALRSVDRLRADLASGDGGRIRRAALAYLDELPDGAALRTAVAQVNDPDAILALLRAGPVAELRARTDALGRAAAAQIFAVTAASPSAALDGLLVGWRGVRLVRQVAALHGQRPGLLGTLALLRRTAMAAVGVMGTELAVNALAHAALSNPLLSHLAGDMAAAGVAARRMAVLARAAAAACSPLEE